VGREICRRPYAVFVSTGSDMGRLRALGKPAGVYFEHDLLKDWGLQLANVDHCVDSERLCKNLHWQDVYKHTRWGYVSRMWHARIVFLSTQVVALKSLCTGWKCAATRSERTAPTPATDEPPCVNEKFWDLSPI
jgi:hypothetical protein